MKSKRHIQRLSARGKTGRQANQNPAIMPADAEDLVGVIVQRYLADLQSGRTHRQ